MTDTSVVLRVSHAKLDLDACLARLPANKVDSVWRAGERGLLNTVYKTSGFNLHLTDGHSGGTVVQDAVEAFRDLAEAVSEIVRSGADAEVDFGLFLDVAATATLSVRIEPAAAAVFERAGVTIKVTAYPCSSDDENDSDEGDG